MNFSTNSNTNIFRFNNSILNELNTSGQRLVKEQISEILSKHPNLKLSDLSIGLEFTDRETSHYYDSFTSLFRYTIFSHTQVAFNLVIVSQGKILERDFINMSNLEKSYQELIRAYTQKLGLILMSRTSKEWESKGQPATLESFVKNISTDPLA